MFFWGGSNFLQLQKEAPNSEKANNGSFSEMELKMFSSILTDQIRMHVETKPLKQRNSAVRIVSVNFTVHYWMFE